MNRINNKILSRVGIVILALLTSFIPVMGSRAYIQSCLNPTTGSLVFPTGQAVNVCCVIEEPLCDLNTTYSNETLTLMPREKSIGTSEAQLSLSWVDSCSVQLTIEGATAGSMALVCTWQDITATVASVYFIDPPHVPQITEIITSPQKNIKVKFDRGVVDPSVNDNYTVIMVEHVIPGIKERTVTLCQWDSSIDPTNSALCELASRMCECEYTEKEARSKTVANIDVTFIVEVSRPPLQKVNTTLTTNLLEHVQPDGVRHLAVEHEAYNQVRVLFCMSRTMQRLASLMHLKRSPLHFDVALYQWEGVLKSFMFSVSAHVNSFDTSKCMSIIYLGLTPFTSYTLLVSGVGTGGEGPVRRLDFATKKTVPLAAPETDQFGFFHKPWINSQGQQQYALGLIWQPLPHAMIGGANLTYDLEVLSGDGVYLLALETRETYAVIFDPLPLTALTVRIWARNEIGRSQNFSTLLVAEFTDAWSLPYQVEFTHSEALVHVERSALEHIDGTLSFHVCENHIRIMDVDICTSYPRTTEIVKELGTPSFDGNSVTYNVDLERLTLRQTHTTKQSITYHPMRNLKTNSHIDLKAEARVLTIVEESSTSVSDGDDTDDGDDVDEHAGSGDGGLDDTDDPLQLLLSLSSKSFETPSGLSKRSVKPDLGFHKYNPRRTEKLIEREPINHKATNDIKTLMYLPELNHVPFEKVKTGAFNVRKLLEVHTPHLSTMDPITSTLDLDFDTSLTLDNPTALSTKSPGQEAVTDAFHRVFVSMKSKSGAYLTMMSAQCYFTKDSDDVRLVVTQVDPASMSGDDDELWLRWRQECDRSPSQFLTVGFGVFMSDNELCRQNTTRIQVVDNPVFEALTQKLSGTSQYACVEAYHEKTSDGIMELKSQRFAASMNMAKAKSSSGMPVGAVVGLTVGLVLFFVVICTICTVRHCRKKSKAQKSLTESFGKKLEERDVKEKTFRPRREAFPHSFELPKQVNSGSKQSTESLKMNRSKGDSGVGTFPMEQRDGSGTSSGKIIGQSSTETIELSHLPEASEELSFVRIIDGEGNDKITEPGDVGGLEETTNHEGESCNEDGSSCSEEDEEGTDKEIEEEDNDDDGNPFQIEGIVFQPPDSGGSCSNQTYGADSTGSSNMNDCETVSTYSQQALVGDNSSLSLKARNLHKKVKNDFDISLNEHI